MTDSQKFEYRQVTPEEKLQVTRLQNIFFSFHYDEKEVRERIAKEGVDGSTYAAIDGGGRVLAGMEVIPFTMWFDGRKAPMYGIGAVVSAPEHRRQGHIRNIFAKAFEDIHEKGAVFSHLYPFSHDYYRKFGYEACGAVNQYTLPIAPARALPSGGSAHEFIKGDRAQETLADVYEAFASRHNLMVSRSRERWNDVFNITLFGDDRLYYWKDAQGDVKAWVKFKRDDVTMRISDLVWADHQSMLGILRFLGMFDGAAEKMVFRSSPELIPELYWNNLYDIEIDSTTWLGMSRIVNVRRALEMMGKPKGEGRFVIKVADDFAGWNNNTYAVEFDGGECAVKVTQEAADMEVTQRALTQMILGVYAFGQTAERSDVQIHGNRQLLEKAFPKKNLLITDYF